MKKSRYHGKKGEFDVYDTGRKGPSEKLVVFTNGLARSPQNYRCLEILADHYSVRVKALELAGRNNVRPLPQRGEEYAKLFVDYINSEGINRGVYSTVGHSAGGLIVAEAAQIDSGGLDKVVALNPALPAGKTLSLARLKNFVKQNFSSPERFWFMLKSLALEKSPILAHQFLAQNPLRSNRVNRYFTDVDVNLFGEDDLSKMSYDLQVVYGTNDEIIPLLPEIERKLQERGAKITKLKGKWHNWPVHDPELAADIVYRSLSQVKN